MTDSSTLIAAADPNAIRKAFDRAESLGYDGLGLAAQDLVTELVEVATGLGERYFAGSDELIQWSFVLKGICDRRTLLREEHFQPFSDTYIDYWAVVHQLGCPILKPLPSVKDEREYPELRLENLAKLPEERLRLAFEGFVGAEAVELRGLEHVTARWVRAKERQLLRQRGIGLSHTSAVPNRK